MNNAQHCRKLINELLTQKNADGSLVHPKGLFVHEIKDELHGSWDWGDIGAALNARPLSDGTVLQGIYAVQDNGYAAKRWMALTTDNPYMTQSMKESVRAARTQIRKTIENRLKPALTLMMYARGEADDLPTAEILLDQALKSIDLAIAAGDNKAARIKAEKAAKTALADKKAVEAEMAEKEAELTALKAKLAEVEAKAQPAETTQGSE